jgi:hypothetical protein
MSRARAALAIGRLAIGQARHHRNPTNQSADFSDGPLRPARFH